MTGLFPSRQSVTAPAIDDSHGSVDYGELLAAGVRLRRAVPAGARVAVRAHHARAVAVAIVALDGWAARVDMLGSVEPPARDGGYALVIDDAFPLVPAEEASADEFMAPPGLTTRFRLFTSGTTGEPKPVDHTLVTLSRTVRPSPPSGGGTRRWGLLYEPTRMAGMQVLLQALAGGDHLLDATDRPDLSARLHWLADAGVEALSATPTVWRQVLQSRIAADLPLRQITLGGEIADQKILDALGHTFPGARITHIFASTETGAAFAVNDRREGFPRAYLDRSPHGIRLQVRGGELFVHVPGVDGADADGFVATGDMVELADDRVRFLGRASGVVNVGGVTVSPEQVESALRASPEVVDAVVTPRRNPFSGWILTARVVPAVGADATELPARLRSELAEELSSAHVPASIKIVPSLDTSATGKVGRR